MRWHREWMGSGPAVAAVLALAIGVPLISAKPAARVADERPIPAGTQVVSFHGVEVFVPAAWTLNDAQCGTPMHDTVIFEDGSATASCLVPQPPGLTVVRVTALDGGLGRARAGLASESVTVDGQPALRGSGVPSGERAELAVLVVSGQDVVISVESPDAGRAGRILDSARVVSTDVHGCVDPAPRTVAPAGGGQVGADVLVPDRPTGGAICRYSGDRLVRSVALASSQVGSLTSILNALPVGLSQPGPEFAEAPSECAEDAHRGFVVRFGYSDGSVAAVSVHISGCKDLSASNGARTTKIDERLVTLLVGVAGYDGGYPNPGTLR